MEEAVVNFRPLTRVLFILGAFSIVTGSYWFYRTHIWKPQISVLDVDYAKGIADLEINGKLKRLYTNQSLFSGGEYGVRFNGQNDQVMDRIELLNRGLVVEILDFKS